MELTMSNIKLYECADDVMKLLDALEDGQDLTPDTIEMVLGEFKDKGKDLAAGVLNLEAQAEMLGKHIRNMQAKQKVVLNKANGIKNYLSAQMQRTGILEIRASDGTFTAKFQKNPPRIDVYDESLLPENMLRIKTTVEPDKTAIKEAIQSGQEIQGARIVQSESLRIK